MKRPPVCLIAIVLAVSAACGSAAPSTSTAPSITASIASVTPTDTPLLAATSITFTGGVSPASGGETYSWQFGDGGTASGQTVSHVFTQEGSLTTTLTVTSGGAVATTTRITTVKSVTGCWQETTKAADRL